MYSQVPPRPQIRLYFKVMAYEVEIGSKTRKLLAQRAASGPDRNQKITGNKHDKNKKKKNDEHLELGRFHSDRDANEDNADQSDGGVALPVHGATVGPTSHTPNLGPEIPGSMAVAGVSMSMASSSHLSLSVSIDRSKELR
jgi:hypothetical protein